MPETNSLGLSKKANVGMTCNASIGMVVSVIGPGIATSNAIAGVVIGTVDILAILFNSWWHIKMQGAIDLKEANNA